MSDFACRVIHDVARENTAARQDLQAALDDATALLLEMWTEANNEKGMIPWGKVEAFLDRYQNPNIPQQEGEGG